MTQLFKIPAYSSLERLIIRVGLAAAVFWIFPFEEYTSFDSQPHPRALGHWIDFSFLSNGSVYLFLRGMLAVALILFVLRRAMAPSLVFILGLLIAAGTLRNSQGGIGHDTQTFTLAMIGPTLAWLQYEWTRLRVRKGADTHASGPQGLKDKFECRAIYYALQITAATYMTAGLTKMWVTDGRWIRYLPNLSVQIIKSHYQEFYNTLDPSLIDRALPIARLMVDHPNLVRVVFGAGLYVELLAFLAMANRKAAAVVGVGLLGMHIGITEIMELRCPLNVVLIVLLFLNIPYVVSAALERFRNGRTPAREAA